MSKVQTVRAKFWVSSVQHHHQQGQAADAVCATVAMAPVYDEANKDWSKWTPQGQISMTITNPAAIEALELGKQYFVDFTPAPTPDKPVT